MFNLRKQNVGHRTAFEMLTADVVFLGRVLVQPDEPETVLHRFLPMPYTSLDLTFRFLG